MTWPPSCTSPRPRSSGHWRSWIFPADVQVRVEGGELAATVAAELTKLPDATLQAEVAQAVVAEGLTRTEVTELVQAVRARRPAPEPPTRADHDRPGRLLRHGPLEEGVGDHGTASAPQGRQAAPGRESPEQAA